MAIHAWYASQGVQCDEIPDLITHVKEVAPLEMALYPVPAQDQVTVRCPQLKTGAELQLLNGMGQVVRTMAWPEGREEMRVDLNGVPNGLYVARLSNASDRLMRSLVVLH
ncbi:MAG: T9SS type A sorting domain-containing protein [Flavobacteriales bacterium]|nr:T9SS type A sorting domain-containing protein [Flavobacteriales bacterium]